MIMRYKVSDAEADAYSNSTNASTTEKKWGRRNRLSCSFLLAIGLSLILAAVCCCAAVLFFIGNQNQKSCVTEECVLTASRMLKAMDKSVAPCEDFYSFACGGWEYRNPVPESSTSWDQLAKLREQLTRDLRELLEAPDYPELPSSVRKAKALYRTCMDIDQIERDGIEPIKKAYEMLKMNSTPPNEEFYDSENSTFIWQHAVGRVRRSLGLGVLVGLHVTEDVRNTSRNRLVMEQVTPGFSEKYLLNPDKFSHEIEQYRRYISAMISAYDENANATQFAEDIISFSTELGQIMTSTEVRRSGTHLFHEVTVKQLFEGAAGGPEAWKELKIEEYLKYAFENTNVTLLPDEDKVIVMDLPYMQKLAVLLTNTDDIIIEKFVWWSVFSTVAPLTKTVFKDLGFAFTKEVFGLQQKTPRWKGCTANVNANFGIALSYLYVTKHFDRNSREKAINMLEDVRKAFAEAVVNLDWMDNSTRVKTLNKLKAIRNYVGFPAWLLTTKQLDAKYNKTEVVEGKLFDTFLKLTNSSVKKGLESLREKPDRNRWVATPTTVNAFYSATLNSVTFPAGILQPPFYGNGLESINYGSIGAIMGHEVTHGFDDQGRRYDEKGNLKQWWSSATLEYYQEKVQCIIDQYNQYQMAQLPNYTVHGFNTQGENIADNGGLRAALNAYKLYSIRTESSNRERLPSMEQYTPEQLFFLGFAQIWCGNSTIGALKSKLVEGVHSPNKIRVIGTLSNSKEFADAWNCPAGSPMNPKHKCVLW